MFVGMLSLKKSYNLGTCSVVDMAVARESISIFSMYLHIIHFNSEYWLQKLWVQKNVLDYILYIFQSWRK